MSAAQQTVPATLPPPEVAQPVPTGRVLVQQPRPAPPPRTRDDVGTGFRIPLELPGPEVLFRLDSEA